MKPPTRKQSQPRRKIKQPPMKSSMAQQAPNEAVTLPYRFVPLTAEETSNVLERAGILKGLGISPDALLHAEMMAEVSVRFLEHTEQPTLPALLRRIVESPLEEGSRDALDAPSVRQRLKRARTHRKMFGHGRGRGSSAQADLDAAADAIGLSRDRGGQVRPEFDHVADQQDYATYMVGYEEP